MNDEIFSFISDSEDNLSTDYYSISYFNVAHHMRKHGIKVREFSAWELAAR